MCPLCRNDEVVLKLINADGRHEKADVGAGPGIGQGIHLLSFYLVSLPDPAYFGGRGTIWFDGPNPVEESQPAR